MPIPSLRNIWPSDDVIIPVVRNLFHSLGHDPTGKYYQFLHSDDLKKSWSILSTDFNLIQLGSKGCVFLCRCNANVDKPGIAGHMFISWSKFISVCDDCGY